MHQANYTIFSCQCCYRRIQTHHLSKIILLTCILFHKKLYQPQIPFEIFCPIPHGGVCRIPNPSKNLSCVSFLWEKTCVKFIFISYSSYPVASWPVCKLFLWYPDPSANFSFGILTRLQTHPLASWPVCKLFLWHLELSAKFSFGILHFFIGFLECDNTNLIVTSYATFLLQKVEFSNDWFLLTMHTFVTKIHFHENFFLS